MALGVFGDTLSFNYDFFTKVANSVAECPMELYYANGGLDLNNVPSPLGYPTITTDYINKVAASTNENAHICYSTMQTSLFKPSQVTGNYLTGFQEITDYDKINSLNSISRSLSSSATSVIAQQLFSLNLIRAFEDNYGIIPGTTDVASKVTWLKNNINKIVANWYGYGSCPSGNKAYFAMWDVVGANWTGAVSSNTSNVPSLITRSTTNLSNYLDPNGFIHFLAYTDAANSTIASTIYTDYINLQISIKDQNSVVWYKKVTDQKIFDKLKTQNELPIQSTNTSSKQAVWNGKTLILQSDSQPAVRDDFSNKTIGSTTENPHLYKRIIGLLSQSTNNDVLKTLLTPAQFLANLNGVVRVEDASFQTEYNALKTQDGTTTGTTTSASGYFPQQLFSFNIVEMVKRKYGDTIGITLSEQIAWCKANIDKITANWYGYGSCPSGNKAYLTDYVSGAWNTAYQISNTANTSTLTSKAEIGTTNISNLIDSNGFIHYLAYTDSASTTSDKMIVLTNHGLSAWDVVENVTRGNVMTAVSAVNGNVLMTSGNITGQTSGDTINKYRYTVTKTLESGTTDKVIKITNHGLSTGDWICCVSRGGTYRKVTVVDTNTLSVSSVTGQVSGDTVKLYPFLSQQIAESAMISSSIYTDYINLDIQFKAPYGYDALVPQNPRRDSISNGNYDNVVLLEKGFNSLVSDFKNKTENNTTTCPHISKWGFASGSLNKPSDMVRENITSEYQQISSLDNDSLSVMTYRDGEIPQTIFSFNLIRMFEDAYGTIGATDKVAWLKQNFKKIKWDWYGNGSSGANKAQVAPFNVKTLSYITGYNHTNSVISNIAVALTGSGIADYIDNNGFTHLAAYNDIVNGSSSTIATDYIKLTLEFNNNYNAVEFFTGNSTEIEMNTLNKASTLMIECDLAAVATNLGGNAALKSAFKNLQVDVWTQGSGSNNATPIYGTKGYLYNNNNKLWELASGLGNSSTAITKGTLNGIGNGFNVYITDLNKLYILLTSSYSSDGTIPSQLSLDYINVKVDISKTPDNGNPLSVNLPQYWGMVIKGWTPTYSYDVNKNNNSICLANFIIDSNNRLGLWYYDSLDKFVVVNVKNGITRTLASNVQNFNKYQSYNFIFGKNSNGMFLSLLKNSSTIETYTNNIVDFMNGVCQLMIGQYLTNITQYNTDAFIDSCALLDLTNKPSGLTDQEIQGILQCTTSGYENPELFDINKVNLNINASKSNGVITLNAMSNYNTSYLDIPVFPNNRYEYSCVTDTQNLGSNIRLYISEYYNNILIKSIATVIYSTDAIKVKSFITGNLTNKVRVTLTNDNAGAGTFTFSNISLKRKD